jgi:DHA2 family multidrug resistance protein
VSAAAVTESFGPSERGERMFNPWLVAVILSVATFMEVLDTSIANVALRHIAGGLSAGVDESAWTLTSYLVSNAVVLPISGWLASTFGRKRFYMTCVAMFTVSSLLCGLAPSLGWLVFFRVLQGLGGGGLAPSEQSMLADSFPPEKHGQVFALYGVAVVVAPAVGPTLGGWITDNFDWRWIFLINVPIGIISLALTWWIVPKYLGSEKAKGRAGRSSFHVDYIGFILVALGLGFLQLVLDKGEREDWFSSNLIVWGSVVAVGSLAALCFREFRREDPIVDLPLLRDKSFLASNMVMFVVGFVLYSSTQLLPELAQDQLGYTATLAGLVLTPGGFATMATMPLVGFLVGRVQPRKLVAIGLLFEGAALVYMTGFDSQISYHTLLVARLIQAAGLGFLFVPINSAAFIGLPPGKRNNGSALINLSRNMGGSFGISLAQTWLARRSQFHQLRLTEHVSPSNPAYRHALHRLADLHHHAGATVAQASQRAVGGFYLGLRRQAEMLAYLDLFWILAFVAFGSVAFTFLMRNRAGKAGPIAAH